tara:strand:- start:730 stop:1203 length:474 start_codon:yes stop_codon:yes gene_type:complete
MEKTMTPYREANMYGLDDFNAFKNENFNDLNNKLFCTFTDQEGLENLLENIQSSYNVMYNKIFVLYVKNNDEYVCTYNVDQGNIGNLPDNTIMVHRKKETNTLYTINALNELIKKLNGGVVDTSYRVNWLHYKNSILLTQNNELNQLNTKIHQILEV